MKNTIKKALQLLLFLGIGLVILYFVYQNSNASFQAQCKLDGVPESECSLLKKLADDFKGLNFIWVFGVCAAFIFSNFIRALRWKMLLKPLGRNPRTINSFLSIMLGYFANLGFPRLGEVMRPVTLAKYEKMPIEKVLGTMVIDRIMDVISLLIIIGLAFLLEFDTLWGYISSNMEKEGETGSSSIPLLIGAGIIGVLGLLGLYIFREKIQSSKLFLKLKSVLIGFKDGVLSVRELDNPFLFIVYSILIWVAYFVMFYSFLPAFNPTAHLGLLTALMVFVFGSLGIVVPSPGGMGSYHFLVISALALYGISASDAFSFANFSFFASQLVNIILGLIAIIFLPIINKNYHPQPIEEKTK